MTRKEICDLLLSEEYRYANAIIDIIAPTYSDSPYQTSPDRPSSIGIDVLDDLLRQDYDFLFTEKDYYKCEEIQVGLEKREIDPKAFWKALMILDYMAESKFHSAVAVEPHRKTVERFLEALISPGAKLIVKKKKSRLVTINSPVIIRGIYDCIEANLERFQEHGKSYYNWGQENNGAITERISYEAHVLKRFFKDQYLAAHPNADEKKYRHPLLLISRLLRFTNLATDDEYLVASDRLRGDLNKYKEPGLRYSSSVYLF